jgi:hypothetical protein
MPGPAAIVRARNSRIKKIEVRDTKAWITIELDAKTLVDLARQINAKPIAQKAKAKKMV